MCVCVCVEGGCSLGKKGPLLIYILSKGTTVSSVRAQMVLCGEEKESKRKKSSAERFEHCCSGYILVQLELKKVDKFEFSGSHYAN